MLDPKKRLSLLLLTAREGNLPHSPCETTSTGLSIDSTWRYSSPLSSVHRPRSEGHGVSPAFRTRRHSRYSLVELNTKSVSKPSPTAKWCVNKGDRDHDFHFDLMGINNATYFDDVFVFD